LHKSQSRGMPAKELLNGIWVGPIGSVAISALMKSRNPSAVRDGKVSVE
jgi:hypothetical protein